MTFGLSIPSYVNFANVKRFGKMIPYYICDGSIVQQESLEKLVRGTKDASGKRIGGAGYKNFGTSLRKSFLETEKAYKGVLREHGSFWKYAGNTFKKLPSEVGSAWTTGKTAAQAASKSGIWGGIKGAASALGKRLPLIGSAIYAVTEIPNIFRATADGGIVSGAAETVKTVGRMVGFTAGAAIGQALCPIPFVGAVIGGMIGDKLASLVTGKSYTEQKEEIQQETLAQTGAVQGQPQEAEKEEGAKEIEIPEEIAQNPYAQGLTKEQLAQLAEIDKKLKQNPQLNVYA